MCIVGPWDMLVVATGAASCSRLHDIAQPLGSSYQPSAVACQTGVLRQFIIWSLPTCIMLTASELVLPCCYCCCHDHAGHPRLR